MKLWPAIAVLALVGCGEGSSNHILTYEELVKYPVNCERAQSQLAELRQLQAIKNFNPDPDELADDDRKYNARLKATIWWFAYKCGNS